MAKPQTNWRRLAARVALAAYVLAVSLFQAPAVRHVHAGGDKPHTHHDSLQPPAEHGCDPACECAVIHGLVPHLHLVWFGFEIMLPEQSPSQPSDARAAQPMSIVRLNEASRLLASGDDATSLAQIALIDGATWTVVDTVIAPSLTLDRRTEPILIVLCDVGAPRTLGRSIGVTFFLRRGR